MKVSVRHDACSLRKYKIMCNLYLFSHCSFPFSTMSIGLAINKEVVAGLVYNPMHDEMYTATKGGGAFCNGKKISVSGQEGMV